MGAPTPSTKPSPPTHQKSDLGEADFQRGLQELKENKLEDALRSLTAAETASPEDSRIRNFRGIILAQLHQNQDSLEEFREAIRLDPQYEDAFRNAGFLEWTMHFADAANRDLGRALELNPQDEYAHYYLGRVKLDEDDTPEALKELDESKNVWPKDAAFRIELAYAYDRVGRKREAQESLSDLDTLPLTDEEKFRIASIYFMISSPEMAIHFLNAFEPGENSDLTNAVYFDRALSQTAAGKYTDAIASAQEYADWLPASASLADRASAESMIGIAQARTGDVKNAAETLAAAAHIAPNQEELWLNLTLVLMQSGRYSEALTAVQESLRALPNSYSLQLRLGAVYIATDHYGDAESVFRNLIDAGDPLPTSYVGLAQVMLRTGRAAEAAAMLAVAEKRIGPNFLLSYYRGLALEHAGKPQQAVEAYAEALNANPGSAEAHFGLGKSELESGHPQEAIQELKDAMKLDPSNVQAQRLLSRAYRKAGDLNEATKYMSTTPEPEQSAASGAEQELGDFILPDWRVPDGAKN